MKRPFGARPAGYFTLSKHWIVANRRSEREIVFVERVRSLQEKISKNDTQTEQPRKWNVTVGPEAVVSFSIALWVRVVHGFNKKPWPCLSTTCGAVREPE